MKRVVFGFLLVFSLIILSCSKEDYSLGDDYIPDNSIVIIPDIQNYTDKQRRFKYLESIALFCNKQRELNHIIKCLQVGDITNNNQTWQYDNARQHFFSKFSKDVYPIFCLGNHDYGNNGSSDQRFTRIPLDLLPSRSVLMDTDNPENYVHYFEIDGKPFAILVLEFATRNETLKWANSIIKGEPSISFIILTHSFLNNDGLLFDTANQNLNQTFNPKYYKMSGEYINDSIEVFEKIVYDNDNVKMIICGHCLSPNYIEYLAIENQFGNMVHCIMVDYQHYSEGGYGYVGCLSFLQDRCVLRSYSTVKKRYGLINIEFVL